MRPNPVRVDRDAAHRSLDRMLDALSIDGARAPIELVRVGYESAPEGEPIGVGMVLDIALPETNRFGRATITDRLAHAVYELTTLGDSAELDDVLAGINAVAQLEHAFGEAFTRIRGTAALLARLAPKPAHLHGYPALPPVHRPPVTDNPGPDPINPDVADQ